MYKSFSMELAGRTLTVDVGRVAAQANGVALRAIEILVDYCNNHLDGGRPLSKNLAATFKIAELEAQTQACRQLVYHTAKMRDAGLNHGHESCCAKIVCTENAINATRVAMDIMGVNGLEKGSAMEKLYRDARILSIYEGTNQVQRLVVTNGLFPKKKKK